MRLNRRYKLTPKSTVLAKIHTCFLLQFIFAVKMHRCCFELIILSLACTAVYSFSVDESVTKCHDTVKKERSKYVNQKEVVCVFVYLIPTQKEIVQKWCYLNKILS